MTTSFTLAAALVLASSSAFANVVATDGVDPPEPIHRALDGRIGMLLGGSDVGDADGFSAGISGALGYRINNLTLRGMVDYFRVGDGGGESLQRRGRATRLGGAVRYSFANTGFDAKVGVDFWGEAGLGYEHVAWRQGGVLDRPSGELAFGLDIGGRGDMDRDGKRREVGYFMAFRTLVGQGPEMNVPAVCGGPCTEPTQPPRTDISMFFELGVHWTR